MYLKSLEMQGFKSFPDKTKLTFERGTSVIVGPNGSGKSNISDAMRWVLGEISSKNLRGTKMEDIIFGGADSRRPMGFAEVSVTFDNTSAEHRLDCPYDEVTVTRRYYRAGESEYFINRRACRLRDVYELFMNTGIGRDGYSIIGQGKIAEIISRKSDERRSIFEDASGIAKYRHRKTETERKLKTTEENMTRLNDVFLEVEAQVGPLEKEAERAKKAIDLLETKKKADVQLWLFDSERMQREVGEAEELFRNSSYDLKIAEEAIEDYNARSERLFEEQQANKIKREELNERIHALIAENSGRDSQYRVTENSIANMREKIAASGAAIEQRSGRLAVEVEEGDRRRAELSLARARAEELETAHGKKGEEIAAHTARAERLAEEIATALCDVERWENEATDIRVRCRVIETSKVTDSGKNESMTAEIDEYRAVSQRLAAAHSEKAAVVEGYGAQIAEAEEAIAALDGKIEVLDASRRRVENELSQCKMHADSARARVDALRAMEENFEGYNHSVRYLMEAYAAGRVTDAAGNRCGKIYGPLSKVIQVEGDYVTAIETALGINLQHIVVEDESVAKTAISYLKRAEAGRATFFPVSSMRGQTPTPEMKQAEGFAGYIGIAAELVQCDERFCEIVSSLLGRTLVFDTLDRATEMAKRLHYRVRVVTLDGQVINAGGSFTGGSVKQKAGILSRSGSIADLSEKLKIWSADMEKYRAELAGLEKELAALNEDRTDAEDRRQLLLALQGSEASTAAQLQAKLDANNGLIEKLSSDFDALNRQRAGYDEELSQLTEKERELRRRIEEIGALRAEKDVERNTLLDERTVLEGQQTELYIALSAAEKDIETILAFIADADARADQIREEIASEQQGIAQLQEEIREAELRQEANRNTFAEGERVLKELNERYAAVSAGDMAFEKKISDLNAKLRDKMAEKDLIFRTHTINENKLNSLRDEQDKLTTKFWEDYEMSRNEALSLGYEQITAAERAATVELQTSCRNRLRAIGNVDLDAVSKYKEVKERYDYMSGQLADLNAARADLEKIIRELEGEMKTSFVTTFKQINENFNRTFSELFGGGSAELSLTDPEDVLASGIEIKAAPPGKIIKNLVQLSGGEQSFIAIALLFAIMQVNPTPFFILDEIEAALDEVNVARFAAYIKRYSLDTQFILITHRRGTMEAAHRLYGVTMPERGISKVLSLDVNSISSKKEGDDWNGIFG